MTWKFMIILIIIIILFFKCYIHTLMLLKFHIFMSILTALLNDTDASIWEGVKDSN